MPKLKREGFGFAASLEGSYPIALGNGWTIEPQAQLVYQTLVNGSAYDEAAWAEVRAGVAAQVARNTALYASAGYPVGFDGRSHTYDGRLGIKVTW